jgi:hypothetical protein
MTDQKSAAETRAELEDYLAIVGLRVAVETAIAICKDPKATAAARASATNSLLRAGALGGFARNYDPTDDGKELHEMSAAEIQQRLKKLRRDRGAQLTEATPIGASAFE